ncbi:MAG: flagellar biosynthesis protein FlhB [Pseudomonadales bacterium]|nr:flagellar biosynthesis protein FlhB [Pseudomonadales bacterium]
MNDDKKAVALFYDGTQAPEISAVGSHALAERIVSLAKEHNIPIYENAPLVEMLAEQQWGERIPPELYRIVAEIIAFVYLLQGRRPKGWQAPPPYREVNPATDRTQPPIQPDHQ